MVTEQTVRDYESVRLSVEVKRYLEANKRYRRETLDDVIRRLLKFDKVQH